MINTISTGFVLLGLISQGKSGDISSSCKDYPPKWVDYYGFNCAVYEGANWCAKNGKQGPGWDNAMSEFEWLEIDKNGDHNEVSAPSACCACGGGILTSCERDKCWEQLADYLWEGQSEVCVDKKFADGETAKQNRKGQFWWDSAGFSCRAYYYGDLCTLDGQAGDGWKDDEWGSMDLYLAGGMSAKDACCVCGGGEWLVEQGSHDIWGRTQDDPNFNVDLLKKSMEPPPPPPPGAPGAPGVPGQPQQQPPFPPQQPQQPRPPQAPQAPPQAPPQTPPQAPPQAPRPPPPGAAGGGVGAGGAPPPPGQGGRHE